MDDLEELWDRIEGEESLDTLIPAISQVILARLDKYRDNLGYWEKLHLACAIADLAQSRASGSPAY
ncbi:hypothetical protein [Burkholderia vietnamiensis]|uniref:hypothetical protein n=1 Tax=Burkholderia vietnamiensis TaxID=60552 RepID=UPI000A7572E4|nr:hypothetical protein [Burkholderia vietnamiensis]